MPDYTERKERREKKNEMPNDGRQRRMKFVRYYLLL